MFFLFFFKIFLYNWTDLLCIHWYCTIVVLNRNDRFYPFYILFYNIVSQFNSNSLILIYTKDNNSSLFIIIGLLFCFFFSSTVVFFSLLCFFIILVWLRSTNKHVCLTLKYWINPLNWLNKFVFFLKKEIYIVQKINLICKAGRWNLEWVQHKITVHQVNRIVKLLMILSWLENMW